MYQVIRATNHPEEKLKSSADILEFYANVDMILNDQALTYYTKLKQISSAMSARDFIEKKFVIREGDKYYVFYSAVPDFMYEYQKGMVRGYTIVGILKYTVN